MRTYQGLGYLTYAYSAEYLIVKADPQELQDFSRTVEMRERFKNWHGAGYPPELVRLFIMTKASYTPRTIVCEELKKYLKI